MAGVIQMGWALVISETAFHTVLLHGAGIAIQTLVLCKAAKRPSDYNVVRAQGFKPRSYSTRVHILRTICPESVLLHVGSCTLLAWSMQSGGRKPGRWTSYVVKLR